MMVIYMLSPFLDPDQLVKLCSILGIYSGTILTPAAADAGDRAAELRAIRLYQESVYE